MQTEFREVEMEAQEISSHHLQGGHYALHPPVPLCRAAAALRSVRYRLLSYTTTTTPPPRLYIRNCTRPMLPTAYKTCPR